MAIADNFERNLEGLRQVMAALRSPEGCPWDREQDHFKLIPYLIEEAYEVIEAIESGKPEPLREELGDLLFQVVFHAQLASERGWFNLNDVIALITGKMIRRHPHVFGEGKASNAAEALGSWNAVKEAERRKKAARTSVLDGIPRALPALVRARRTGEKAAGVGFDWKQADDVLDKIHEELEELKNAHDRSDAEAGEELGDLLFAAAQYARKRGLDPEQALHHAIGKFERRFHEMERSAGQEGVSLNQLGMEELDRRWNAAKAATGE